MLRQATEENIRQIYQATIDGLFGFVVRRCDGDRDLAEDITQESWLRAIRAWHADGLPDVPAAWLTTVARRLLANHFRRRPFETFDDNLAEPMADETEAVTEARQSPVSRALARLSVPHRRLLQAFHFEKRRVADIAAEQGLTERAVEGRLRRARQQLRHHIESDSDTEGELP